MLSPADHQLHTLEINRKVVLNNLAVCSSGNASIRSDNRVCIKPSGVDLFNILYYNFPILDLATGQVVNTADPFLKPSTDTASHLYLYRAYPTLKAIVHTHSPYATAFAVNNMPIPCAMTALADEFGGDIPCAEYARIGDESIGKSVCDRIAQHWHIGDHKFKWMIKACLLARHGVITLGWDSDPIKAADKALKSAIMLEDCAKILAISMQLTTRQSMPFEEIAAAHDRYSSSYGQSS